MTEPKQANLDNSPIQDWALRNGSFVHADEVSEKGYKYTCWSCKNAMNVKKGPVKRNHFAHKPDAPCCNVSGMTTLHKVAQYILFSKKEIILPKFPGSKTPKRYIFDKCEIEGHRNFKEGEIWVDVFGYSSVTPREIALEVKVTSEVKPEKETIFKKNGILAVEIDLSLEGDRKLNRQSLEEKLIYEPSFKKWLSHPDIFTFTTIDQLKHIPENLYSLLSYPGNTHLAKLYHYRLF